ncbi:MAG: Rieske 2Fe-2S domain-containing protein [Rhodospirillales bacterium]|nr:Rieske 2Fe-2S domain-containing protein [Rhodospirillales bacterium]
MHRRTVRMSAAGQSNGYGGWAELAATRAELKRARHAPGRIYASPEIYQREIESCFMQDWLYAGRVEEVANPGDYMAIRLVEQPVVIARDKMGALHASYNMCAHRGVEVAYGSGNTRSFKCPYHGWVYDLSGELTGAAYMKESDGFDQASCRLKPVRLDTWRGNLFISFNPDARPLSEFVAEFEKDFAFLGWEKCRLGNKIRLELDCNWKFFHENLMDFYHVGVLHAKSFGAKFSWTDDNVRLKDDGGLSIFYKAGPPTPGAEPLLGKMPWLEHEEHSFACTGLLPPNFTFFGRIDCIRPMIAWPLGPNKCEVLIYHLFPEEFFQRPGFDETLKVYREYQIAVLEEDRTMIESMQRAMALPVYEPGPMSVLEKALHHYVNSRIARIFPEDEAKKAAE